MTFVITGTLEEFSRDKAKEVIEELGGKVTSSVSKNTDYLVCGENPGSKLDNAKKHGVKILEEAAFKKLLIRSRGGLSDRRIFWAATRVGPYYNNLKAHDAGKNKCIIQIRGI